ncbi:MAG: NAD(P)-dependent glycerol-3-phosphate dehydrogenase [Oscillospiraceae bacterium]|jgi:glycerol-3-phosphate dehydrogenase (NAD(P)+)|nr:NAD(P)-dependent glycerol-3-phosphate dehydrogenase [Oscillospiraceae bacterium]
MTGKIAVLGAGAWGITLADMLTAQGHPVALWSRNGETARQINEEHRTPILKDIPLRPELSAFTDPARALDGAAAVVSVIVSHGLRGFLRSVSGAWPLGVPVLSASKGLEEHSCKRMSQVFLDELDGLTPEGLAVLSGPNLAGEIARRKPASTVVACPGSATAAFFQSLLHSEIFRVYTSRDVLGVELGGAIKNVVAIAAGMCTGLDLGDNAAAALATRGVREISRLGARMGADPETFAGMAGYGDVFVTCFSRGSRNRGLGEEIGRGRPPGMAIAEKRSALEGVHTVTALCELGRRFSVPLPISETVRRVLFEDLPAREALGVLMGREAKAENV